MIGPEGIFCNELQGADLCLMEKTIVNTPNAPAPIGPYSQAVRAGNFLFISGQIPIDPATGKVEATDAGGETHQVMHNLKAILAAASLDFGHVVKTTILLTDMTLFGEVNEIYGKYFNGDFPARETYAVKSLPKNVSVEISMIAVV
jgi:2-iminobutanoate/2-iminopropanoate deaminase